ncbi:MAG TPA: hypothetical protein VMH61_04905 [Candidatus Acidoferrales bacterium]|nr:hypothetical protein [Candidatus Acidoferrales bacterium]
MTDLSLHLAPNAPWIALALVSLALLALATWAYRFALPPLSPLSRRLLAAARAVAFLALLWLLAQPVLERGLPASGRRVLVLVDRSGSMDLPASRGGPTRAQLAGRAADEVARALRGRATIERRTFAATLGADSLSAGDSRQSTALGDALGQIAGLPVERRPDGVVVVSDGIVNAGQDPVEAARDLGVPVHTVLVGAPLGADRAIAEVEASRDARVGEPTPVRVRVLSSEPRGGAIGVRLFDDGREIARATVLSPGPGAEAVAELRPTPTHPGLAVWTARVDSLAGDAVPANDARGVAVQVAPGKIGVLVLSGGPTWDLAFLRRAWLGDSSLALDTRVRNRGAWRALELGRTKPPEPADLRGKAVVVLDALPPADVSAAFDQALAAFVRNGGGLLLLGGPDPGLARFARGALAHELALARTAGATHEASPQPTPAAGDLIQWDSDPARGEQAWRVAPPLADVQPLQPGGGDRVLLASQSGGAPLLFSRRAGRGPVLLLNGSGFWRWSLSGNDPLAADRARLLWRRVARWLAEPVQGEPLRVTPERWLTPAGEPVRLFATLQDAGFRPVAGATVEGEASDAHGARVPLRFTPDEAGSYETTLPAPAAGRWQVNVHASGAGRETAQARGEFAVDTWSLEALRTDPDSSTLAAVASASGGREAVAADAGRWAHGLSTRSLVRRRTLSTRLWESPLLFALIVGLLGAEWIGRRRRGLP